MNAPSAVSQVPVSDSDLLIVERALFRKQGERFSTSQRLFFRALLSDPEMNPTRAARAVGLKPARCRRWLDRKDVQAAISHLIEQRMKRAGVNADNLLMTIVDLLEMAKGDKPVKKAAFSKDFGGYIEDEVHETDLSAAARFTDQLAKHLGIYQQEAMAGMQVSVNLQLGEGSTPPPVIEGVVVDGDSECSDAES